VAGCCLGELALGSQIEAASSAFPLLILAGDVKLDAVLLQNRRPLAALATRMPTDASAAVFAVDQLRDRIVAALPEQVGEPDITEIWVTGPRATELAGQLQTVSFCPVRTYNPEQPYDLLPLATAGYCQQSDELIDLLPPTLPPDPWQAKKRELLKRGAVAAAAIMAIGAGLYIRHGQLSDSLTQSQIQLENTQAVLDHADPVISKWQFLTDWQDDSFSVTNELLRLSTHLPKEERAYLTRMQIEDLPGKEDAVLRLDGVAKESRDVMALNRTLLDANYDLRPHGIEPPTRDKTYKAQFRIEAGVTAESTAD